MSGRLFTKEQLPVGFVMFISKLENGEEVATALTSDASDERIIACFKALTTLKQQE